MSRRAGPGGLAVLLLLSSLATPALATPPLADLVERVEVAYRRGDAAGLAAAHRALVTAASSADTPDRAGYYAAYARFRQALASAGDGSTARGHLDDCIADLTGWVKQYPEDAEARALLGSCYGLSTNHYPLQLVNRGLEARRHLTAARKLAPASPWVLLQDGLADFATPRLFGGSSTRAIAKLERAARLFEEEQLAGSRAAGWAVVETWEQLALMYTATNQAAAAAEATARAAALPTSATLRRASLR